MIWKTDYRSIYYLDAPEPPDIALKPEETALLVIDVQNTYRKRPDRASLPPEKQALFDLWTPFYERLEKLVIPNTRDLLDRFRKHGIECLFARIASHTRHGRERSLSHRKPGWNDLLLPKED
jgi:nicotinamidase-related amidase